MAVCPLCGGRVVLRYCLSFIEMRTTGCGTLDLGSNEERTPGSCPLKVLQPYRVYECLWVYVCLKFSAVQRCLPSLRELNS
jgi:hypothetical protein